MRILRASAMLAAMLIPAAAWAQEFEFKSSTWVNTRELSLERLKGKVVVLYFFEEG
jgi:hypothetical protein